MESLIKSVVILYTVYLVSNPYAQNYAGSGFFFTYENSCYIATCRYCIDNFDLPGFGLKMDSKSKTDNHIKNLQIITQKKDWFFNPNDNDSTTYDIAIFRVGQPGILFENYELSPIKFPHFQLLPKLDLGDSLIVIGYPQSQIDKRVFNSDTIPLRPYVVKGEFLYSYPKSHIKAEGNKRLLQSQYFIKIDSSDDLKGISGGLVLLVRENKYYPIGIVTSSSNCNYMGKELYSIVFTPIGRIYETIDAL